MLITKSMYFALPFLSSIRFPNVPPILQHLIVAIQILTRKAFIFQADIQFYFSSVSLLFKEIEKETTNISTIITKLFWREILERFQSDCGKLIIPWANTLSILFLVVVGYSSLINQWFYHPRTNSQHYTTNKQKKLLTSNHQLRTK